MFPPLIVVEKEIPVVDPFRSGVEYSVNVEPPLASQTAITVPALLFVPSET